MNNEYLAIYNEQFENTGECQYSEYLGCKKCSTCKVEEYEKEVKRILEKEHEKEQEKLKKMYDAENMSSIYEGDELCVYNEESEVYKNIKHNSESRLWEAQMSICYDCNRCGMWGKK